MADTDFSQLAASLTREVGPLVGNVITAPEFSGEVSRSARQKAFRFLQKVDLTAYKLSELDSYRQKMVDHVDQVKSEANKSGDGGDPVFIKQNSSMDQMWYEASEGSHKATEKDKDGWFGKKVIMDVTGVSEGNITQLKSADGDPLGFDQIAKHPINVDLLSAYNDKFRTVESDYVDHSGQVTKLAHALPTQEQIQKNTFTGKLDYKDSVFSHLNGSFQPGDKPSDGSAFDRATLKGSPIDGIKDVNNTKSEELPKDEKPKEDKRDRGSAPVRNPGGGTGYFRSGGGPGPSSGGSPRSGGGGGSLDYEINKVDPDDIYDKIKDKFGIKGEEGSDSGSDSEGTTGIRTTKDGDTKKFEGEDYTPRRSAEADTHTSSFTPSSSTPSSYTPSTSTTGFTPSTTSFTPSTSSSTPSSSYSSPSGFASGLTSPRSSGYSGGSFGSPSGSTGSSGLRGTPTTSTSTPLGSSLGRNASSAGTGSSAAGGTPTAKGASGSGGKSMGGMGRAGMPMGMMPMGGMGSPGAGGKGGSGGNKNKVTNKEQDLYGADINSVAPVIKAGSQAAGIDNPVKSEDNDDKKEK